MKTYQKPDCEWIDFSSEEITTTGNIPTSGSTSGGIPDEE